MTRLENIAEKHRDEISDAEYRRAHPPAPLCPECGQGQVDNAGEFCGDCAQRALLYPWGIELDIHGRPVDPDPPESWEPGGE